MDKFALLKEMDKLTLEDRESMFRFYNLEMRHCQCAQFGFRVEQTNGICNCCKLPVIKIACYICGQDLADHDWTKCVRSGSGNAEDYFFLLVPSHDGRVDGNTNFRLNLLPRLLNKGFLPCTATNKGIPAARTELVIQLKNKIEANGIKHNGIVRAMFWDDDVVIDYKYDVRKLATAIQTADKNHWNLVGNYRVEYAEPPRPPITPVLMHTREGTDEFEFYTQAEVDALENLSPLPNTACGLGFYYGDVNLDYKFWYAYQQAEDGNFYKENSIALRYLKIQLWHKKMCYI